MTAYVQLERFEPAALRWHGRFERESIGLALPESELALTALGALRGGGVESHEVLKKLVRRVRPTVSWRLSADQGYGRSLPPARSESQPNDPGHGSRRCKCPFDTVLAQLEADAGDLVVDVDAGPVPPMFWLRDPDGNSLIIVEPTSWPVRLRDRRSTPLPPLSRSGTATATRSC